VPSPVYDAMRRSRTLRPTPTHSQILFFFFLSLSDWMCAEENKKNYKWDDKTRKLITTVLCLFLRKFVDTPSSHTHNVITAHTSWTSGYFQFSLYRSFHTCAFALSEKRTRSNWFTTLGPFLGSPIFPQVNPKKTRGLCVWTGGTGVGENGDVGNLID
jgi:hypothetical protein